MIFELTFIALIKFRETRLVTSPSIFLPGSASVILMILWGIYSFVTIWQPEDEDAQPEIFRWGAILTPFIYFLAIIFSIMYI